MKLAKSLALFIAVLPCQPAYSKQFETTCNLRYNNLGIIHGDVPCRATFRGRKLQSLYFVFPSNRLRYNWSVGQPGITADPRWDECIRHTGQSGNQWQACTVPSPSQLGL